MSAQHGLPAAEDLGCGFRKMKLACDYEALGRFCRERDLAKLELFCSALQDQFQPGRAIASTCWCWVQLNEGEVAVLAFGL